MSDRVVPVFSLPLTWSSAIGLFLLNFGTLEMLVFAYFEKCLLHEFEKWRGRHFKERIERIGDDFLHTEAHEAYAALLGRMTSVRELRNHLAHGYLQIVFVPGAKEAVIGITQAKDLNSPFAPETRHLTFTELQEALTELNAVIEEFRRLTDNAAGWKPGSSG